MDAGYAAAPPGDDARECDWFRTEGVYHVPEDAAPPVPRAVVWTALPLITWLLPFIGHVGITRAGGCTTDFSGPFTVTVGSLMCGPARRVWRLEAAPADDAVYDRAVYEAARVYGKRRHNLVADNCHSHVAHALNEMAYGGRQDWNMLRVWLALMRHGRWVAPQDAFWTYLPFVCLCALVAGVSVASALTK